MVLEKTVPSVYLANSDTLLLDGDDLWSMNAVISLRREIGEDEKEFVHFKLTVTGENTQINSVDPLPDRAVLQTYL